MVLQRAKELTKLVYRVSARLPRSETFGLQGQLRRASVSIVANIAEGLGRGTQGDVERHLRIAAGSAAEVASLLDVTVDIYGLEQEDVGSLLEHLDSLRRMLHRFIGTVHRNRR